jgi:hypothetical protein
MEHEKQHVHLTHEKRPDENGELRGWWHVDFRSFQGAMAIAGAIVILVTAAWGVFAVVTVSLFDPHIRRIVREEVPAAMQAMIDTAIVKAAEPHMEKAKAAHERLQGEIDTHAAELSDIRTFRDKMFTSLQEQDTRQSNELAALRAEVARLETTQRTMYELLLKIEADGKLRPEMPQ